MSRSWNQHRRPHHNHGGCERCNLDRTYQKRKTDEHSKLDLAAHLADTLLDPMDLDADDEEWWGVCDYYNEDEYW